MDEALRFGSSAWVCEGWIVWMGEGRSIAEGGVEDMKFVGEKDWSSLSS